MTSRNDRRVSMDRKSWASFYEAVTQLELSGRGEYLMEEPIMFGRAFTNKPFMSYDAVTTGEQEAPTGSEIRMWGTSAPYEALWNQSENPFMPGDSFSMTPPVEWLLSSDTPGAYSMWWTYGHINSIRIKLLKSRTYLIGDVNVYLFGYANRLLGHFSEDVTTWPNDWVTVTVPVDKDVYNERLTVLVVAPQGYAGFAGVYVGRLGYNYWTAADTPPPWTEDDLFYEIDWTPLSGTPPERFNANFGRLQGGTFSHQANEPYIQEGLFAAGQEEFWDEHWFQLPSSGPRDPYTYNYVMTGRPDYNSNTDGVSSAAYGYALDPTGYTSLEDWPGNGGSWGGVATGAKFTTDGGTLQYVRILMRTVGSPTDSLVGKIATTLGGTPFAVSSPVSASKVAPNPTWKFVTFTFPANTLAAGTYYLWVERTGPEGSPGANYYNVAYSWPNSVSWQNKIYSDDTVGTPGFLENTNQNLHFFIPGLQLGFPKWGELRQIVPDGNPGYFREVPFVIGESPAQPWVYVYNSGINTASASNVDPTTGFAGRWYWATVWDYRQLLGGPYTLRGQAGDTFHAMTTVTVDNNVGSPYVRGWVAYYDSDMNFVAEHYGSHWPTPTSTQNEFPVLFSDTFPSGAEYATVGWEAWSDDPSNSNTVWRFATYPTWYTVRASLYLEGAPPQGTCWIVSDDPPPGHESKFSCGYLFTEDGSSPWLTFSQTDYYGIYTLWDHDDTPGRVDYPGHTTVNWGTITDHPDIPSEYVWTSVGLPLSKLIMGRNDLSKYEWPYYDPDLDGYFVQFSMYADAPATFELVASNWDEFSTATLGYENETHETFAVEHPGDGSWLTREAWFPDTFGKYQDRSGSWWDDRWAVLLFRAKAAAGTQARIGDVFFSYDFTSRVESDKLTIGVAEWVRGDKGEYVGAKLWLKTGGEFA